MLQDRPKKCFANASELLTIAEIAMAKNNLGPKEPHHLNVVAYGTDELCCVQTEEAHEEEEQDKGEKAEQRRSRGKRKIIQSLH